MTLTISAQLRAFQSAHKAEITAEFGPIDRNAAFAPPSEKFLFLCFTNRCGSNYLARLLAATGAMNEAGEYFNGSVIIHHARTKGLTSLQEYFSYLAALVARDGWVVAKATIEQLIMLTDAGILDAILGQARFILIERQDRLGQAMSRLIAWQNGRWTSQQQARIPDETLTYNRAAIEREMTAIAAETYGLHSFFAQNALTPMHVAYETMIADPHATLDAITTWLQRQPLRADLSTIGIARQANHINAAWRERYLAGG